MEARDGRLARGKGSGRIKIIFRRKYSATPSTIIPFKTFQVCKTRKV